MAEPKVHAKWTLGIIVLYAITSVVFYTAFKKPFYEIAAILFFGILIDGDHTSSLKLSKIRDGSWLKNESGIYWLHTWLGLFLSAVVSYWLNSGFPLLSFAVHMILVDSRNRAFRKEKNRKIGPFPAMFHRFWPDKWTYDYVYKS